MQILCVVENSLCLLLTRSNMVLSTIGANSVTTKPSYQTTDSIVNLMKYKGMHRQQAADNSKEHKHRLSFRPMVMVFGPSESSACWQLGFGVLMGFAEALFGVEGEEIFAMCCADGARSGHLGYKSSFPKGKWLHCVEQFEIITPQSEFK